MVAIVFFGVASTQGQTSDVVRKPQKKEIVIERFRLQRCARLPPRLGRLANARQFPELCLRPYTFTNLQQLPWRLQVKVPADGRMPNGLALFIYKLRITICACSDREYAL